ncbi:unnamed protein product [Closterium sp. NIES-54]
MPTKKLNCVRKLGTPSVRTRTPRPPTPSVPLTKLLNPTGSHGCAAAAGAGCHQGLHAAWLHRDQHHLYHPHHHLHLLHRLHRFPHRPLHHPCFPCPCWCGVAH